MTEKNNINKMSIIIPNKEGSSTTKVSREEILKNLESITPEQLELIAEEMKAAREKREEEEEKRTLSTYGAKAREYSWKLIENKSKNLMGFRQMDYKVVENGETVGFVLLYDYTRNYENVFSDLEYGTKIFIKVGDFETEKEFVYRDAYDGSRDDWSKAYTKIHRLELQGDTLKVWLGKNGGTPTLYEIKIPKDTPIKQNNIKAVSRREKEMLKEYIESEKERLLKDLTKDERYPNIFGYGARQIPNLPVTNIPFDQAIIADEYIDLPSGEAYIVIKTQIDADSKKGKQYSWLKYRLSIKDYGAHTTLVEHFDAREEDLANGFQVKINAKD